MSETINVASSTNIHRIYQSGINNSAKKSESFFGGYGVKPKGEINPTQNQNKEEVTGGNQDKIKRRVRFAIDNIAPQVSSLSASDQNIKQAEDLYYSYILPEVEKTFMCRDNESLHEVPVMGIIHVLETGINTGQVINFLYNDPDFISKIIEGDSCLEFTKTVDLLLHRIKNTNITEIQSYQVFSVLDKLYRKLPEISHIQPSVYGKMHDLFSLVLKDNRQDIIQTLTDAMTNEHNKKYFDLYINDDGLIENNYLNLIVKIYSSSKEIQESDYRLFEKLISFLGKHDFIEKQITSAKALHFASSISDIISTFDLDHQDEFIKYFLERKIDGYKFDEILVQTLDQKGLLEKYHYIKKKKNISKIVQYKSIDYLTCQDQAKDSLNEIGNSWLLNASRNDKKQQLLAMINDLDIYNCHSIVNYLSSADGMVYKEVIATKSSTVYEHMIDLIVTKLQGETTISKEDSDRMADLVKQLYIMLPFVGTGSWSLCSKIYKAFNMLVPQSVDLIRSVLHVATNSKPDFYFPLSLAKNKKVISEFLDLVAKIYETPTGDYNLLYELLEDIKINVSDDSSNRKILFFSEKLYKIIVNLQDERQSMVVKSLLDSLTFSVDMKYYLYCLFYDANVNIPECNFKPLDQLAMEHTKQRMALIKSRDPHFFNEE